MLNDVMFIFKLPANLEDQSFTQLYGFTALPLSCFPFIYARLINVFHFTDIITY